ncbi:MAG: serine/threonine protein kinase [Planctomycetaceae bacterium]|jgi:serine/threonine protein kinase|nr:serine/threonine protein kinase [Planctomycetaceae bacterium]
MTQISTTNFIDYLQRSRLIGERQLSDALTQFKNELGTEGINNVDRLAKAFISHKLLTEWQVRQLFKKRYKGFFLRQYKILSHIGAGGMSTVYLAEHSVMQRRVAIKVLPQKRLGNSAYLNRFIREAQTIASLDHPNIVRAYDFDQEDDVHYIVMEYFNGRNLQEIVDEKGVPAFETAVDYIRQTALALEYAHQAGVVHRDVKPGNILVNSQGLVKVLDLGLALFDEPNYYGQLTMIQDDKILGTADYLAPEQGIDSHKVDGRADIYGLGCVLYFCLTGRPPFPTGSVTQRLLAHQREEPKPIYKERPDVPDGLEQICRKMMAKKKEKRQQSALEVVADLQNWLIENGFAESADFPPLDALRASPKTMGARPILSQEQRLEKLTDKAEKKENEHFGIYNIAALEQQRQNSRDPAKNGSSAESSASHVHLLGGGKSSSFFQRPEYREPSSSHSHAGIIMDDDDLIASKKAPRLEENDPVLFAMNEMQQAAANQKSQISEPRQISHPQNQTALQNSATLSQNQQTDEPEEKDYDEDAWYRSVPIWFWRLFGGLIVSVVFLVGIIIMLVLGKL